MVSGAPAPSFIQVRVVDSGVLTAPAPAGQNLLGDNTKKWAPNIHDQRVVRVRTPTGAIHTFRISGNTGTTLVLATNVTQAIPIGSSYEISEFDIDTVLLNIFLGGTAINLHDEFAAIIAALSIGLEASVDTGIATGGSNNTLEDTNKNWPVNLWGDASIVQVEIGGINYLRWTVSNTATVVTIGALPGGVAVAAGCPYSIKRQLNPLNPLDRALEHNTAELAGVDILGAALAPTNTPCRFAVEVAFDTAGVFSVTVTNGGVTVVEEFNHGVVLPANSLFRFSHLVHAGDTINYRYSVNATMLTMRVQEIVGAT